MYKLNHIIRMTIAALLLCCCEAQQQDQGQRVISLLQSMMNGGLVSDQEFHNIVSEVSLAQTAPAVIEQALVLARKLVDDPRVQMQRYGVAVFIAVQFRPSLDGGLLIGPYLSDFETIAGKNPTVRPMVLNMMSLLHPVPQRTMKFMSAHLNDKDNTLDESNIIMATLLQSGSDLDTRQVIEYARRADYPRQDAVLRQMGLRSSKNADVVEFIRWSFEHTKGRRAGIDAVSRLPRKDRVTFSDLMARISADPKEADDVRDAAREELRLEYLHF